MTPQHPSKYSTADYLRLMTKGVGKVPPNESKEIGIIGGGMAGLVAGWLLKEAGHEIRLYEANKVVGGRIKTLRERFTSGLYAEAGAMRIPKHHKLTMWLIDDFKLKTYDGIKDIDNCRVYINGRYCTYGQYKNGHNLGLELKKNEVGKTGDQLFKDAIAEHIGTARIDSEKWDRYSLRQFLREKAKLSLGA